MRRIAALSLSAAVALTAAVSAENWPQWRGPNGQGISSETRLTPSVMCVLSAASGWRHAFSFVRCEPAQG